MSQVAEKRSKVPLGLRQVAIIPLTVATAAIHFTLYTGEPMTVFYLLNGLGYLTLLAALYLPIRFLVPVRRTVRLLLIGYAALTILAWVGMGDMSQAIGWIDKAIEVALIAFLVVDVSKSQA
jgi:hypothetical protein